MLSRNKTDENNMSELRMMKKQKLLILLMTTNESADHNNIFYTFQELSLFLIKYSFILYDNTIERKFFKRVFYPHGEIFFQNPNGARYLDPKYSRWVSTDPALGEYVPLAPVNDEAKKHNENLPGMGGLFNTVNLSLYHYAGNNPVKYLDPDGREDFYFLYTMDAAATKEFSSTIEERLLSENHLVKYVVNLSATKDDILKAFADPEAVFILISGHGSSNSTAIITSDDIFLNPDDIPEVSNSIKTVIFECCFQGSETNRANWAKRFGEGVTIVGWETSTNTSESINFNNKGDDCRQEHNLEYYIKNSIINAFANRPLEYRMDKGKEIVE